MSKWQNPAWSFSLANATDWSPAGKPHDQHSFNLPSQGRNYPYNRTEHEDTKRKAGSNSPPKMSMVTLPLVRLDLPVSDETVPRPMVQQQPIPPHMRAAYVNMAPSAAAPPGTGKFPPVFFSVYPVAPPEYTSCGSNVPVQNEQWNSPAPDTRHSPMSGIGVGHENLSPPPPPSYEKQISQDSSSSSPATDSASVKDDSLLSSASSKVTKRSRMGCLTCRHRKKRCCESRPKCLECVRLRLECVWPKPGTEHKNKPKEVKSQENTIDHDVYGKIRVLRGIVEYRSD